MNKNIHGGLITDNSKLETTLMSINNNVHQQMHKPRYIHIMKYHTEIKRTTKTQ